jgi:hypothetical protein
MSDIVIQSGNSNKLKTYTIPFKSTNRETPLVLHGPDSYNYGQDMLTNLVHLLENFCNTEPPANPVIGQTYYNSNTRKLNVRNPDSWKQIDLVPNNTPVNVVYIDNSHDKTYTGDVFSDLLAPYITLSGNTKPVAVTTSYTSDNPHQAVTKDYVDKTLVAENFNYVPLDGGTVTMSGPLKVKQTVSTDPDNTAVSVGYVNGLGALTASVDTSDSNFIITKYEVAGQKDAKGNSIVQPKYTVINFNTVFTDSTTTIRVSLPAGTVLDIANSRAIINCNIVGVADKVHVVVLDGANFTLQRDSADGDYHVQGTISGFTA